MRGSHQVWVEQSAVPFDSVRRFSVQAAAMAKNFNALEIPVSQLSQAVSDGELNMSARGCGGSSSSLPGTPGGDVGPANSVLSWAVSFEKLLEDPCGVSYFTAFLKSEVSAENILFWQECEKFRKIPATSLEKLKAKACSIYKTYLSDCAPYSVNIDDTAKVEEKDLEQPTPDMFNKAQAQIFKLMKMDSYRRFVRSPMYQSCTLASVEGKFLPQLSSESARLGSWEEIINSSPSTDKKNKRSDSNSLPSRTFQQKRESLGDPRREPHMSTSSVELGALCRQMESVGTRAGSDGGYCCVYLPDGSASLAPTRNGQPIKDMLASLCEKRGFPLNDVVIYLKGKDKPLQLDQDCSVLKDQQVTLELRVKFALEIAFIDKTVVIMAKSKKTLQDALSVVMQKHQLKPQDVLVTIVGSDEPVSMNCSVYRLANKTVRLDKIKGKDQTNNSRGSFSPTLQHQGGLVSAGLDSRSSLHTDRARGPPRPRKNREMDGFLDMLTKAQCCRVEDQRGLLTKEQLEVPLFLQIPSDEGQETHASGATGSTATDSKTESEAGGEAGASVESKPKDLRETSV
ncbi:regulator of G-protein signaling 14 isoform X2 [Oryzias melastigma]|uniref:Regulator of G protein signaling 14a n=1 Tax=Oryzias melastigma TaxID=30732 RepID=A0A3B3BGJ9_ORYME|nr:regulator of G-protein signaling 14 isoform X2 [Oryzias melastigma]